MQQMGISIQLHCDGKAASSQKLFRSLVKKCRSTERLDESEYARKRRTKTQRHADRALQGMTATRQVSENLYRDRSVSPSDNDRIAPE
jgi:hypothetical protein